MRWPFGVKPWWKWVFFRVCSICRPVDGSFGSGICFWGPGYKSLMLFNWRPWGKYQICVWLEWP